MTTPAVSVGHAAGSPATVKAFHFQTSLILPESTGLRAATLPQLATLLRTVPASSIYHHTHYFLLQHHYLTPGPSNDFAYWVTEVVGEERLGEMLASIDVMAYESIDDLRKMLVRTIRRYLAKTPVARLRFVGEGEEFFFMKAVHVIMPTPYTASTLQEFADALERVSLRSLYFHMFDARLRVGRRTNDFAVWLSEQLGLKALGEQLARLDPYTYTLDSLRSTLLTLVRQELNRRA